VGLRLLSPKRARVQGIGQYSRRRAASDAGNRQVYSTLRRRSWDQFVRGSRACAGGQSIEPTATGLRLTWRGITASSPRQFARRWS